MLVCVYCCLLVLGSDWLGAINSAGLRISLGGLLICAFYVVVCMRCVGFVLVVCGSVSLVVGVYVAELCLLIAAWVGDLGSLFCCAYTWDWLVCCWLLFCCVGFGWFCCSLGCLVCEFVDCGLLGCLVVLYRFTWWCGLVVC